MINKDTEVCVCNDLSAGEIAECIKKYKLNTLAEILENTHCPVGDKCESCVDEGFNNDGINVPLVLSLVQKSLL